MIIDNFDEMLEQSFARQPLVMGIALIPIWSTALQASTSAPWLSHIVSKQDPGMARQAVLFRLLFDVYTRLGSLSDTTTPPRCVVFGAF